MSREIVHGFTQAENDKEQDFEYYTWILSYHVTMLMEKNVRKNLPSIISTVHYSFLCEIRIYSLSDNSWNENNICRYIIQTTSNVN